MTSATFTILAAVVAAIVQAAKKTDGVPVTSNNAKIIAFGLAGIATVGYAFSQDMLTQDNIDAIAGTTVALGIGAIGAYETLKSAIKKTIEFIQFARKSL